MVCTARGYGLVPGNTITALPERDVQEPLNHRGDN